MYSTKMTFAFYLFMVFLVTLIGGLLPLKFAGSKRYLSRFVATAAGLLIGTALFHILPESINLVGPNAGWPLLVGFALFYLPAKFVLSHPCEEGDCDYHTLGYLAFFGIAFHSMVDGIGVGASAEFPDLAPIIISAIAFHKFPAAIALSAILMATGMKMGRVAGLIVLFSLATPLGAVATNLYLAGSEPSWLGWALGLTTGNLLAVAGSDLLRRIHDEHHPERLQRMALLILGVAISLLAGNLH